MPLILHKILKLYFYNMYFARQLKPQHHSAHLCFALHLLARMQVDKYCPSHILWRNYTHFHLDGAINTKHCHVWGSTNPHALRHGTVCIHGEFRSEAYFFEEVTMKGFVKCTVTNDRYSRPLENHVVQALKKSLKVKKTV